MQGERLQKTQIRPDGGINGCPSTNDIKGCPHLTIGQDISIARIPESKVYGHERPPKIYICEHQVYKPFMVSVDNPP